MLRPAAQPQKRAPRRPPSSYRPISKAILFSNLETLASIGEPAIRRLGSYNRPRPALPNCQPTSKSNPFLLFLHLRP